VIHLSFTGVQSADSLKSTWNALLVIEP